MKKVLVFAVVCAIAFIGCMPMPSTTNNEQVTDHQHVVTDDTITDETGNDSNVVVDEKVNDEVVSDEIISDELVNDSDELIAIDEETDSEVSDDIADNEEVLDDTIPVLPEANVFLNIGGDLANGEKVSAVLFIDETSSVDLCIGFQITGATMGIDFGMTVTSTCGAGTVKIVAGATATEFEITNLNKSASDKHLVVAVLEGEGYELGESVETQVTLLGKEEETSDEDTAVIDSEESDDSMTDEASDIDTVVNAYTSAVYCYTTTGALKCGYEMEVETEQHLRCRIVLDQPAQENMTIHIESYLTGSFTMVMGVLDRQLIGAGDRYSSPFELVFHTWGGQLFMKVDDPRFIDGTVDNGGCPASEMVQITSVEGESSDTDEVETDDSVIADESPDADSVEETDTAMDEDSVTDDDVVESETDVLTDVDEAPDTDVDNEPLIIATNPGPSAQCHTFQTLLDPGTRLELWDASNHSAGLVITNDLQVPVWYQHIGWCSATANSPIDARGEVPYPWTAMDTQCVAHNGDLC